MPYYYSGEDAVRVNVSNVPEITWQSFELPHDAPALPSCRAHCNLTLADEDAAGDEHHVRGRAETGRARYLALVVTPDPVVGSANGGTTARSQLLYPRERVRPGRCRERDRHEHG